MSFSMVDGIATINLDSVGTLALALVLLLIGNYLRNHVAFLERFCIPAPVAGGFTFSFIHCVLYMTGVLCFEFDTAFQSPAMIAFFTCVGLATSLKGIKRGGKSFVIYYILCCVLIVAQSVLSIVLSTVTGIEPIYGFLAGSTTMVGGHGNGGRFSAARSGHGRIGAVLPVCVPAGHRRDGAGALEPVCSRAVADDRALERGGSVAALEALLLQ